MTTTMADNAAMTMGEAAEYLRDRIGCAPHRSTVLRWTECGVDVDGERVYLQAVRVGGRTMTRPADVNAFLAAINAEGDPR